MKDNKTDKNIYWAYLLPARSIVFFLMFLLGSLLTKLELSEISSWWTTVAVAVNILTIILLLILTNRAKMSYAELIGLKKEKPRVLRTVLIAFASVVVGMAGMYLAGLICYGTIMPRASLELMAPVPPVFAVINAVLLPATVAFAEDVLYLGCGVNNIKNKYAAVIVPAFFYALQHCFIPTLLDARYILYRFLSFLPLTVAFCIYYRRKRDPLPLMIGHAVLDLATVMTVIITSLVPGVYEEWCAML